MDGFYSFIFYGLIAVGGILIISLTVLRIDWARHPEKYAKDVENYEKEQYRKKNNRIRKQPLNGLKKRKKRKSASSVWIN